MAVLPDGRLGRRRREYLVPQRKGRVSQNWPFNLYDYWRLTRTPNPDDYTVRAPWRGCG